MIEGIPDAEIARRIGASREAVYHFRKRHPEVIEPVAAEIERQIIDFAIANKVNRIAELQHLYDMTRKEVDEYGITIVEERTEYDRDGSSTVIKTRDYRSSLVKEARAILSQVAEELDQLPRGTTQVNIDNRVQVLIREIGGFDPAALG